MVNQRIHSISVLEQNEFLRIFFIFSALFLTKSKGRPSLKFLQSFVLIGDGDGVTLYQCT